MSRIELQPSPFQTVKVLERTQLADILAQVEEFLCRYIAFRGAAQSPVIALWVAHSHAIAAFDYTPYLHVSSPEKRCGKSRLLDLLILLVRAAWCAVSPSEAVIYRKIAQSCPTLLLDEVDTIFSGGKDENKEGLRALLNAGFTRSATVPRCVGPQHEIKDFPVFCAKVIAGIGRLPDTVADRSVPIILARKTREQNVERFRTRDAAGFAEGIRAALAAWAGDETTITNLRAARPMLPDFLGDRQADICEPLLAIADAAGGEWPERARTALAELFAGGEGDADSLGTKLLDAMRHAFTEAGTDRLSTDQILDALLLCEDAPWVSWWEHDIKNGNRRGPASKLARMLKPFGIVSGSIRLPDGSTPKGYKAESCADAFDRYLPAK
jgi:hypothetical protein